MLLTKVLADAASVPLALCQGEVKGAHHLWLLLEAGGERIVLDPVNDQAFRLEDTPSHPLYEDSPQPRAEMKPPRPSA